jgi:hypothetical protein
LAVQFGIATMKMTPQTSGGSPDSNVGPITMGILQNVSLDFSFDFAQLYGGSGLFPVDVRVHTGSINGQAEEAEMTGIFFALLTGGTQSAGGSTVTFTNTTQPTEWQLELELATDLVDMNFTLNACRSSSFNVPFARDSHVITGFQFQAFADSSGNIGTLIIDDPS